MPFYIRIYKYLFIQKPSGLNDSELLLVGQWSKADFFNFILLITTSMDRSELICGGGATLVVASDGVLLLLLLLLLPPFQ